MNYFLKIALLFLIVVLLTWYGKYGRTDVFSPSSFLTITGNRNNSTLHFINQSRGRENVVSIHCSGNMIQLPQRFNQPQRWSAIFLTPTLNIPFDVRPENMFVADSTTFLISFPENLPEIQYTLPVTIDELTMSSLEMDTAQKSGYFCSWKNCTILIVYNYDTLITRHKLSELHEKVDILIIYHTNAQSITLLRSVVRPLYTVAFCSAEKNIPRFPNLLIVSKDEIKTFFFRKDKNRPITLFSQ